MTTLPRPPSIFDDNFDALASKPASTDFYMQAPPGEKYRSGQLLGIVVNGQHVHTGRGDPHVAVVRQLLALADADARNPASAFPNPAQPRSYQAQVAAGQYTYPYLYTLTSTPEQQAGVMQGMRPSHTFTITRTINQASSGWYESPVLPIMVGRWGNVNIDPDGGGIRKPPGYGASLEDAFSAIDVSDVGGKGGKPFDGNGFLYLVADSVTGVKGPVVLLVGEKGYPSDVTYTSSKRRWSPPGGGYKKKDNYDLTATAWREFWEETGADLTKLRKGSFKYSYLRKGKNSAIMMVRINLPAETVERIIGLKAAGADLDTKMHADLSSETKGYVWATLDALKNADAKNVIKLGPKVSIQLRDWRTHRADVLKWIV